ncbi:unnamed protein product [Symbiodinium sp. CCMP2592]|nr:unnamed protein product [Symbiodinium sp. CCMP2592]
MTGLFFGYCGFKVVKSSTIPDRLIVADLLLAILANQAGGVGLKRWILAFVQEQLPGELTADQVKRIVALSAKRGLRVELRCWALVLLRERQCTALLAEHWAQVLALLAPPVCEVQQQALCLLDQKMPEEVIAELSGKHREKKKMPDELIAELSSGRCATLRTLLQSPGYEVQQQVLNLLEKPMSHKLIIELSGHRWEPVLELLASRSFEVRQSALDLLKKRMPKELIAEQFSKFHVVLRDADSRISASSRRMLEEEISNEVLAQHFQTIAPSLLADSKLQPWSFEFLRGRISERHIPELIDVIINILSRVEAAWSRKGTDPLLGFAEEQLPGELTADQVKRIVALSAKRGLRVELRCWALVLLRERQCTALLAEHWAQVLALLAPPVCEVQQQALCLLDQKMPEEVIAELSGKHREKKKMPDELIAELSSGRCATLRTLLQSPGYEVQQQVLNLLEKPMSHKLIIELSGHRWEPVLELLASRSFEVRQSALDLLKKRMPKELIAEQFSKFHVVLRDADSRISASSRRMLEEEISNEVLAQHFQTIAPSLLADSKLQPWSFEFLRGRISERHIPELIDVIINILSRVEAAWSRKGTDPLLGFAEEQLPGELTADQVKRIVALSAKSGLRVELRCWALVLLNDRTCTASLAEHCAQVLALLAAPVCEVQQQALYLLDQKMPEEVIAEMSGKHREKVVDCLRSPDGLVQQRALGLLEKKMPDELIAELSSGRGATLRTLLQSPGYEVQQQVLNLLEKPMSHKLIIELSGHRWEPVLELLASRSFEVRQSALDLLKKRMPKELIAEQFSKFHVVLRDADSRISASSRRMLEEEISNEVLAQHFQTIAPSLLADSKLQPWSFEFLRGRISERHIPELIDVIINILSRVEAAWSRKGTDPLLGFAEEQLPGELTADQADRILAVSAKSGLRVELRCWALVLLNDRTCTASLAEHCAQVLALLAAPVCEVQQQALYLLDQKMPEEVIAEMSGKHREKVFDCLRSPDGLVQQRALGLLEKKMPDELIAELSSGRCATLRTLLQSPGYEVQQQVLNLLEKPMSHKLIIELSGHRWEPVLELLASRSFEVRQSALDLLKKRMPKELIAEQFSKFHVVLRDADSRISASSRRMLEEEISNEVLAQHFQTIAPSLLADSKLQPWSFEFLRGRISERHIPELIDVIINILSRVEAAWSRKGTDPLLGFAEEQLPGELTADQVKRIVALSAKSGLRVELRCWALVLLNDRTCTASLAEHWTQVLALLAIPVREVQQLGLSLLQKKMPLKLISELSWASWEPVLGLLATPKFEVVQQSALLFLEKIPKELIAQQFNKFLVVLRHADSRIRSSSRRMLEEKISNEVLAQHFQTIAPVLLADSKLQPWSFVFVKERLPTEHSRQVAALLQKAGHLNDFEEMSQILLKHRLPLNGLDELLCKLPFSCLLLEMPRGTVAGWRDAKGNSWLHLAAEAGHLEACEALVDKIGLPLRQKNKAGDEPLALAASREVDRFLRSRMHYRETRFGYGNVFQEMMQDDRPVSEVIWYTVPLAGMAGRCGGLHSFLVVTVSDARLGSKSYVLEKAGSEGRESHQKHGVFIGNQDLGSNLKSVDGQKKKKQLELRQGCLRSGLKMKELYEVAHGTGPYDLATSNCHHAVQKVFNFCCAREEAARSGSEGSNSDVASANSELASSHQSLDSPSGFGVPVDLRSTGFAETAAALSLAIYEQDPAIVLRPTEAGVVSIRNNLGRPVILYDHNGRTRHRVEAGEVLRIAGSGAEKTLVDIYDAAWAPRLYPRGLAQRQAVWRGHRYNMSTGFRDDVVLQEVGAAVPKHPVDVLHATQKSGTDSPVQWLLARSGSVLYVAFRGTDDVQDAAIDLSAVPDYSRFKEHGIGVHSGIANALEQEGDGIGHVVNDVLQALQEHLQQGEQLILCGHSLGGGYAQVMAVHLLSRNVEVAAVRTFGTPHVLVPPSRQEDRTTLWCTLDSISRHWVHDWDPVPRLPLCKAWLTDVLPKLKTEIITGLRVGIARKYIQALHQHCNDTRAKLLERYDVVGEIVLVSKATSVALRASEGSAALKELLGEKPPESVMTPSKLFAYHGMEVYLHIARKLEGLLWVVPSQAQSGRSDASCFSGSASYNALTPMLVIFLPPATSRGDSWARLTLDDIFRHPVHVQPGTMPGQFAELSRPFCGSPGEAEEECMEDLAGCARLVGGFREHVCGLCDCVCLVSASLFVCCCGHKFWSSRVVADRLLAILADRVWGVRLNRHILKSVKDHLPSCLSADHIALIAKLLENVNEEVRFRTLDLLSESEHRLSEFSMDLWLLVLRLVTSRRKEVQLSAVRLLVAKMPNELLVKDFDKFHSVLRHANSTIRAVSRRLVEEKISREVLALHLEKIVPVLRTDSELQPWSFGFHKDRLPRGDYQHIAALQDEHSRNSGDTRRPVEHNLNELFLQRCLLLQLPRDRVASWRDRAGNTWLHVAAEAGNLEACEALVDWVGLPLREKNKAGDEPLALAASRDVDRFLRSRMHFRETRFGYGNAFEEMMQDGAKSYVLEKVGSHGREAHQKHGIFIGNQDLGSNLRSVDGLNMYKRLELSGGSLRRRLKMKGLYEEAHSTGPYDLASSNCHHAVQKRRGQGCAPAKRIVGKARVDVLFNSARSGSQGSNSDVASANSEVVSRGHNINSPSGFGVPVDLRCSGFGGTAALLSHAVYEEDAAILLRRPEAGTVSIRNKLARPVLVYDHNSRTRHRVQAGAALTIAGCAMLLNGFRPYPWRLLAKRQTVWRGHRYNMSAGFRDDVVLQEVAAAVAVAEPVDVLHATSKRGSDSPVQWILARSGSVLYVAFRGTDDVQDAAIDLCAVPDCTRLGEHGIGVHSGIAHALEQRGDNTFHVLNDVHEALQVHRQHGERLILCGHSLGGGYAQVMAVHLLSRKVDVAAVQTFGAPHVLVPPSSKQEDHPTLLWWTLNSITQHWVHDWDPVPRLPLCKAWLTGVLPKLKQEVVRGLRVGIARKYIQALHQHCNDTRAKLLEHYDVVGEIVLVSKATSVAFRASKGSAALKELLCEKPPESVMTPSKLFAYHSMEDYLHIAHKLTAS